jgi:hypothetical protein
MLYVRPGRGRATATLYTLQQVGNNSLSLLTGWRGMTVITCLSQVKVLTLLI